MKERFLALTEEVKTTGIVETLYNTSNAEEFETAWHKFLNDNQKLCDRIKQWANGYNKEKIFMKNENIENPMETVICLIIINNEEKSECEMFQDYEDLIEAVKNIGNKIAMAIAKFAQNDYFCNIGAEQIFLVEQDDWYYLKE